MPLDLCVKKMKLSKDKTQIRYNDFLKICIDIPPEVYEIGDSLQIIQSRLQAEYGQGESDC